MHFLCWQPEEHAVGRMLALGCCHPGLLWWVETRDVLALVAHRMSSTLATAAKAFSLPGLVLEWLFAVWPCSVPAHWAVLVCSYSDLQLLTLHTLTNLFLPLIPLHLEILKYFKYPDTDFSKVTCSSLFKPRFYWGKGLFHWLNWGISEIIEA